MDDAGVRINGRLTIPRGELELRASRSGGPGGQHVNTSSTRIELVWDIASSPSLDDNRRARLLARLASRLDSSGRLRIVAQDERSQLRNRELAIARFREVVARALTVARKRRPTRPTLASKHARRQSKERRSDIKRERRRPPED
ncbi:MAG: alternative ribosome rescue aminoacyl-tRNA hydrolase ArfB [Gemmatimonadales bacterium]